MSHLPVTTIIDSNIELTLFKTQFCNWWFWGNVYLLVMYVCDRKIVGGGEEWGEGHRGDKA